VLAQIELLESLSLEKSADFAAMRRGVDFE